MLLVGSGFAALRKDCCSFGARRTSRSSVGSATAARPASSCHRRIRTGSSVAHSVASTRGSRSLTRTGCWKTGKSAEQVECTQGSIGRHAGMLRDTGRVVAEVDAVADSSTGSAASAEVVVMDSLGGS